MNDAPHLRRPCLIRTSDGHLLFLRDSILTEPRDQIYRAAQRATPTAYIIGFCREPPPRAHGGHWKQAVTGVDEYLATAAEDRTANFVLNYKG